MKTRKLLTIALTGVVAVGLVGCGSSGDKASNGKKVVTVEIATSPDYPPYESLDKKGNIIGFDADMVKYLDKAMDTKDTDYKFHWNQMSFDNIISQIQADQVDLGVSGFTYDKKRKVEWSNPYTATAQVAVVAKNSAINSPKDLEGKKLAAQAGSTGEEAAKSVKGAQVSTVKNAQQIFPALTAGQYDAIIVDLAVANEYAKNGAYKVLDQSLLDEKDYIIAKQGNKDLIKAVNAGLKKFMASDDYKTLTDKYGLKAYKA